MLFQLQYYPPRLLHTFFTMRLAETPENPLKIKNLSRKKQLLRVCKSISEAVYMIIIPYWYL